MAMQLVIYNASGSWDFTDMVKQVVWSGRKSSAPRTLEMTLVDDYDRPKATISIKTIEGWTVQMILDGKELFRGIIMKQTITQSKENKLKAYDVCVYLSNSKDSFSYDNWTVNQIIRDCIKRAGLIQGTVVGCDFKIESLKKSKTTYYDAMCEAMSAVYKAKGERYYIRANGRTVDFLRRKEESNQFVVEFGQNLTGYSYTDSIEKIKTRYRVYNKEGKLVKEEINSALELKIGTFAEVDTADKDYTEASLKEMVKTMIEESGYPQKTLSVSAIGIPEIISGGCLYVVIPHLGLKQTFYVDEDKHTFKGEAHTMSLKLNFAKNIDAAG